MRRLAHHILRDPNQTSSFDERAAFVPRAALNKPRAAIAAEKAFDNCASFRGAGVHVDVGLLFCGHWEVEVREDSRNAERRAGGAPAFAAVADEELERLRSGSSEFVAAALATDFHGDGPWFSWLVL